MEGGECVCVCHLDCRDGVSKSRKQLLGSLVGVRGKNGEMETVHLPFHRPACDFFERKPIYLS